MNAPTTLAPPQSLDDLIGTTLASSAISRRFSDAEVDYIYSTGQSLMRAGRMDKALSMLIVCALYRPGNSRYLMALGNCHRRLHNDEPALQAFAMASAMDPMNYEAALQVAECLLRLRRVEQSRKVLASLVDCGKHFVQAVGPAARAKVLLELAEGL